MLPGHMSRPWVGSGGFQNRLQPLSYFFDGVAPARFLHRTERDSSSWLTAVFLVAWSLGATSTSGVPTVPGVALAVFQCSACSVEGTRLGRTVRWLAVEQIRPWVGSGGFQKRLKPLSYFFNGVAPARFFRCIVPRENRVRGLQRFS